MRCIKNELKNFTRAMLFLGFMTLPTAAFGLIDAEGLVGYHTGTWKASSTSEGSSETTSGTTLKLAGHLDPIPLVPVSFGLAVVYNSYEALSDMKNGNNMAVIPEIMAWSPVDLAGFKPYGRLGYAVYSSYTGDMKGGNGTFSALGRGVHLGVGTFFHLLPLISLMGEINYADEALSSPKITLSGIKNTLSEDIHVINTTFLVGVQVGL